MFGSIFTGPFTTLHRIFAVWLFLSLGTDAIPTPRVLNRSAVVTRISTTRKRITGRHRYTVLGVCDSPDGSVTFSFNVLSIDVQEANHRAVSHAERYGLELHESFVMRGWDALVYAG